MLMKLSNIIGSWGNSILAGAFSIFNFATKIVFYAYLCDFLCVIIWVGIVLICYEVVFVVNGLLFIYCDDFLFINSKTGRVVVFQFF